MKVKRRPPILSSYGNDPLAEYRSKWRGEDAIDALVKLLGKLGVIKLTKD